jgi:hypothetical protein
MTKLISILIIVLVAWVGWRMYTYWEGVRGEKAAAEKSSVITNPQQLEGLPPQLEASLQAAERAGAAGLKNWLDAYGQMIRDPRRAWIELDYCVRVARDKPAEAKRVFAAVKERTPNSSPVYPRIKQLEKTYE